MKAFSFVVVSLAMSAAMANPPAAKPAAPQQPAAATTTTMEKKETTTTHADTCAGKTGKDLEACNKAAAKKAH